MIEYLSDLLFCVAVEIGALLMVENILCIKKTNSGLGIRLLVEVPKSWPGEVLDFDDSDGIALLWGLKEGNDDLIIKYQREQQNFYFCDVGHFNRFYANYKVRYPDTFRDDFYWRISKNCFLNYDFQERPSDRWDKLGIQIHPWRESNRTNHILLCPGSSYQQKVMGNDDWEKDTIRKIKKITDRKIQVRKKPDKMTPRKSRDLKSDLKNAHIVIAQGSQAAVEAAIYGVPIIVDERSHAWMLGSINLNDIETPKMPDRRPGLYHIAYSQFTLNEVANGYAWEILDGNKQC